MATIDAPRGINRRTHFEITDSLRARMERGVDRRGADECWPWRRSTRSGYGCVKHLGKCLSTHVVSFRLHHGEIPAGQIVLHSCDNRICCNPAHLSAGSTTQNNREARERIAFSSPVGEACANAKLTDEAVRLAHSLFSVLHYSRQRISEILGCSSKIIGRVLRGERWKHVRRPTPAEAFQIVDQWVANVKTLFEPATA